MTSTSDDNQMDLLTQRIRKEIRGSMTMKGMVNAIRSAYGTDDAHWPRLAAAIRASVDCLIPEEDVEEPEAQDMFADVDWVLQARRRTWLDVCERLEAPE